MQICAYLIRQTLICINKFTRSWTDEDSLCYLLFLKMAQIISSILPLKQISSVCVCVCSHHEKSLTLLGNYKVHLSLSNRVPGTVPTLFQTRSSCKNVFRFHQRLNASCLRNTAPCLCGYAPFLVFFSHSIQALLVFFFFLMTTQECFMFDKMRQGHRLRLSSSKAA